MRYAALLRGVSPMNLKMVDLKRALEAAGFADVTTVLSSGNALFTAPAAGADSLEQKAEAAMAKALGRSFLTIVRAVDQLRGLLESEPYRRFRLKAGAKRVVTFLRRDPQAGLELPIELHGARILGVSGREAYSAYVPSPKGPAFMSLIEKTFGKDQTTRTWETVAKLAR